MSITDDYEKMVERICEGREGRAAISPPKSAENLITKQPTAPTEEEIHRWSAVREEALDLIRSGCTMTNQWKLRSGWVEFIDGRSFKLTEALPEINDERILKYFQAHNVAVEKETIQQLQQKYFGVAPDVVKSALKSLIIKYRQTGKI